ncbi:amidohydrolase family protein [Candidatus Poribacteria bacterium]|nr:amidohydrolase family protein [Candidatus Poribacteria bacterium]MYH81475.1 amidohydrolase family protein [Candidatus Poribacteria bacterium]MYK95182.1 amidohydrolase family protein [Candidatus Poribacteria bacterium]
MSINFVEALSTDNLTAIKAAPKIDVHSHAFLSTRLENLERWVGHSLKHPPSKMKGLEGMMTYVNEVLSHHIITPESFKFVASSGVRDAIQDGVVMLEMSFDIRMAEYYSDALVGVRVFFEALDEQYGEQIDLRPELGFPRTHANDPKLMALAHEAVELGVFQSIDLYSHQEACAPEAVKPLYRKAREAGMKLKAHVGEFGGAEEVRRTVEVLDLDEVQHGIGAAESVEVMRWLSEKHIQLNLCPTSNVMLDAVTDLTSHPIRTLFDNGVSVTINTDDLMIFGQSVSEEYRNLYQADIFSAEELDNIRCASLEVLD